MRTLLRTSLIALVLVAVAAVPARAGSAVPLALTVDPTSGPAGTTVTFTPTDVCPTLRTYTMVATLALTQNAADADLLATTPVDDTGTWSLQYMVPGDAAPGAITYYVECRGTPIATTTTTTNPSPDAGVTGQAVAPPGPMTFAVYSPVTFTVTAVTTTTSTSTTSTTTSTTSTTSTTAPSTTTTAAPAAITATPTSMFQGDSCDLAASGFMPGSTVEFTVFSDPTSLGSAVANSIGDVTKTWLVPTDFPTGNHTIVLTGTSIAGQVLSLSVGVTVASRVAAIDTTPTVAATVTPTSLPTTGGEIKPLLLTAAGFLAIGGATLVVARRRRLTA